MGEAVKHVYYLHLAVVEVEDSFVLSEENVKHVGDNVLHYKNHPSIKKSTMIQSVSDCTPETLSMLVRKHSDSVADSLRDTGDPQRALVIEVYGKMVDVAAEYRRVGYATLPPTATLSGNRLRVLGDVPPNYSLDGPGLRDIASGQSVVLNHGDVFYAVPPATY